MTEPIRRPLSRTRRQTARSMTASALVPQFTLERDVCMGAFTALRREHGPGTERPSYSDVAIAACSRALRGHPGLNASLDNDVVVEHAEINVGLAIALSDGLMAPAVLDADTLTLEAIGAERQRLTHAAEAGTLEPEVLFSTTFTITNLGSLGVRRFRALVVPPQAAILAIGAVMPDDVMSLSLSCDHRVVDGAPAAAFLRDVAEALEAPAGLQTALGRGHM